MTAIKLMLFDDHPIFLEGLAGIFEDSAEFSVVGKGASAADAIRLTLPGSADVIVLDLDMPGNVFEIIPRLRLQCPETKILIFTASISVDHAVRALDAGASGYVVKGSTAMELAAAIRSVVNGDTFVTQSFAAKVIAALRNATMRRMAIEAMRLSLREEQIVRLLLRGKTNKEIANQLLISEKTVKHYMTILMHKLNARNRLEVVLAAQRLDISAAQMSSYRH